MNNLPAVILHYLYGLFAQVFNGVIAAICALVGVDSASAVIPDVHTMNFHTVLAVAVSATVMNAVLYFKAHPLPDRLPDNTTSLEAAASSVKSKFTNTISILAVGLSIGFAVLTGGCQAGSADAFKAAIKNPNNIAKATQGTISLLATGFLANNPSYAPDVLAAADGLAALADSDPQAVTAADLQAAMTKTSWSDAKRAQVAQYITSAEGEFLTDFGIDFPELKPSFVIFLRAVANGLYIASGKAATPLPVIPYPPPMAPAIGPIS